MAPIDASVTQSSLQPDETADIDVHMDTKHFVGPKTVTLFVQIEWNGKWSEVRLKVSADSEPSGQIRGF